MFAEKTINSGAGICAELMLDDCGKFAAELNKFMLSDKRVIILVAEASIEYVGRASSTVEPGVRLIILKPDGTLLVHSASKYEPLNWQPPGSRTIIHCSNNTPHIKSVRSNPRESLTVAIRSVFLAFACTLSEHEIRVFGTEKDIRRYLASNPHLLSPGLILVGEEVQTPYGVVDLLFKDEDGSMVVVEIKNERASIQAVTQLKRYVDYFKTKGFKVRGVIVAPSISGEALSLAKREGLEFVDLAGVERSKRNVQTLEKYVREK